MIKIQGFWTEMLGFGDFYYELSVQIVQVCMSTREQNGGFIDFSELKRLVEEIRGKRAQPISEDDVVQSIKCLKPLGDGFKIITVGHKKMVQSVPEELNSDHLLILDLAQELGKVTVEALSLKFSWERERALESLSSLLKEGICWIDSQANPDEYYVAGLSF
jgi:ESCRT-II complex subunit VPS22